ncbi:MAG: ATP-binding cassette domain-containing protein [Candidatus Omnitrophica bacterium]|nr:ATP-binding cassette domain-containing protein [Candidatus Omnitrophota bacterium]
MPESAPHGSADGDLAPVLARLEDVSKNFGSRRVLKGISFELRKGEILGFLGPNGAGKTTAMRILTGYFPPSQGRVWIGEQDLFREPQKLKRRIGYLPESVTLYGEMRVCEFVEFAAQVKGLAGIKKRREVEEKLTRCGLWDVKHRLIGRLSKGFRQRIGIAQALIGDPEILVLDEPSNGLDPKQIMEIRGLIRELAQDRTLILSSHILPEVSALCDRVLIINKGSVIASGTADELESGLRERHELVITLGPPADKAGVFRLLENVPGLERISIETAREGLVTVVVGIEKGRDVRAELSRLFVTQNLPLLEMRSGRLSLEEIFMKLVLEENEDASQREDA